MTNREMYLAGQQVSKNSSAIGTVLAVIKTQMDKLDKEIKDDQKGKKEYGDQLGRLAKRRTDHMARLRKNEVWAKEFDAQIGPFEAKYKGLTKDIAGLYENAKIQHAKGIEVLKREFNYHPAFKRPQDDFFAVPFVPK
jgi:hypothetical protein